MTSTTETLSTRAPAPIALCALLAILPLLSLPTAVTAAEDAPGEERKAGGSELDRIELVNGSVLEGLVVERGGNRVEVEIGGGSRSIPRRDIQRVQFNSDRRASERLEHDAVEFQDGHRVDGEVKVLAGGKTIQVRLAGKDGLTSRVVSFDAANVRRIRWKDDLLGADGQYYTVELEKRIDDALGRLREGPDEEVREARDFLIACGIFAVDRVERDYERALEEAKDGARDEVAEEGRLDALRGILRVARMRRVVSDELQELAPEIYKVLGVGTAQEKAELLKAVFPAAPEASAEVGALIVRDSNEDVRVRAFVVDFLRRLGMNRVLVDLYNETQGQLQLASAIALARNRILLGVPTLIEALSLGDESIRAAAADSLRRSTGQDFRFRAGGTPAVRADAIRKWRSWWLENREEIERDAVLVLRGDQQDSAERKEAMRLSKAANEAWAAGETSRATALLERSLEVDPTLVQASLSLAVISYAEIGDLQRAETILEDLARRPLLAAISERDAYWIHLELGNVYRLREKHRAALEQYEEALVFEPDSITATIAKADAEWLVATGSEVLESGERSARLRSALEGFQRSLELLDRALQKLVVLNADDVPALDALPFERRHHNRSVLDVRQGYELEIVRTHRRIAKVHALLGRHESAVLALRKGIDAIELMVGGERAESRELEAELRSQLGLVYERLGKSVLALKEYRHVLRQVDGAHQGAREGIDRLRRRSRGQGGERLGG